MPAALSYPGVYVEEIPSGVRTIAAVPTSVTVFIGRTAARKADLKNYFNPKPGVNHEKQNTL